MLGGSHAQAAWILNTIIFLICGTKLGEVLTSSLAIDANDAVKYDGTVDLDLAKVLVAYLGINAVRLAVVGLFFWPLRQLGTGFDWRTALVVVWGGLRGSVGLALALIILHTQYQPFWGGGEHDPTTFAEYEAARTHLCAARAHRHAPGHSSAPLCFLSNDPSPLSHPLL